MNQHSDLVRLEAKEIGVGDSDQLTGEGEMRVVEVGGREAEGRRRREMELRPSTERRRTWKMKEDMKRETIVRCCMAEEVQRSEG